MPKLIETILSATWFGYVARTILTFMFWASGLAKLIDFNAGAAEMAHFGLEPASLFNAATLVVQLAGSILIILNKWAWLGAGALAFLLHLPFRSLIISGRWKNRSRRSSSMSSWSISASSVP